MPSPIFISRPPPGFSLLSVIRGIQLTALGAIRALKNPYLIQSGYYHHAIKAVIISLIAQFLLWLPLGLLRLFVRFLALFALNQETAAWFANFLDTLAFIQNNILNIGPFVVTASRYFLPEMDEMFLMSLQFVDKVYKKKHPNSHREYYAPLILRPSIERNKWSISITPSSTGSKSVNSADTKNNLNKSASQSHSALQKLDWYFNHFLSSLSKTGGFFNNVRKNKPFQAFVVRAVKRASISMAIYLLSFMPFFGSFVMPLVSFYTFNNVVGTPTAVVIFGAGIYLPRRWMVKFLGTFWGGRSLVRELLAPYFNRVPYNKSDREHWFRAREGIMFGFGAVFYYFIRTPFFGIIAYGIAEASTAYLITKVTEPPPPPPGVSLAADSPAASGFTSLAAETGATTGFSSSPSETSAHPIHTANPSLSPNSSNEKLIGSHDAEKRWMRKDLSWTNSDKFLSGKSLDSDGFGDAPDIVPGAWASASAARTTSQLQQDAVQQGYKLTPSPSVHSLTSLNTSEQPSKNQSQCPTPTQVYPQQHMAGSGTQTPISSNLKMPELYNTNSPSSSQDRGYSGFSNYEKYNGFAKNSHVY